MKLDTLISQLRDYLVRCGNIDVEWLSHTTATPCEARKQHTLTLTGYAISGNSTLAIVLEAQEANDE